MIANLRVFVSSTCADLFQERRDIAEGLLRMHHNVIVSESGESIPVHPHLSTVASCLEAITEYADVVVLVVGGRYGSTDETGSSITTREFLAARAKGIPVLAFVRKSVLDLEPIWARDENADLSPHVLDNRVFKLIQLVRNQSIGNWEFQFTDASEIVRIAGYQLSCLFRRQLQRDVLKKTGIYFRYVNQLNSMIAPDGTCYRTVHYSLVNNSANAIGTYLMGDTMDRPLTAEEFHLKAFDGAGNQLEHSFCVDTPNYKRWDVIFPKPLAPRESIRFYTQYISCDQSQYQGQHTRHVQEGIIQYSLPTAFVSGPVYAEIRDEGGWRDGKPWLQVYGVNGLRVVSLTYSDVDSVFQFRIRW